MGMAEKYHEKNLKLIQEAVPEPITSAAIFQRKGQMGANLTGGFAAGASLAAHGDAKKAAPGFPENTILGASDTRLYAFKVKSGFSWKLKEPVGIWDRSAVQITATPGKATAQLRFDFGDGAVAELECQTLATNAGNLVFVREVTGNPDF
jgi:hypothetical protein